MTTSAGPGPYHIIKRREATQIRRYLSFRAPERQSAGLPAKLSFMLTWDIKDEMQDMNWAGLVATMVATLHTRPNRPHMIVIAWW